MTISRRCAAGLHAGQPGGCDGQALDSTAALGPGALVPCGCECHAPRKRVEPPRGSSRDLDLVKALEAAAQEASR